MISLAMQFFEQMLKQNIPASERTFSIIIEGFARLSMMEQGS